RRPADLRFGGVSAGWRAMCGPSLCLACYAFAGYCFRQRSNTGRRFDNRTRGYVMSTAVKGDKETVGKPAGKPTGDGKAITRPQNGSEYLDSLRDDRTIYIYGERVKDVTTHPAFRNTARMVARLYDALHDPKRKDKILLPTDTGNGGVTHAFFK